jgi:hypothetical protein
MERLFLSSATTFEQPATRLCMCGCGAAVSNLYVNGHQRRKKRKGSAAVDALFTQPDAELSAYQVNIKKNLERPLRVACALCDWSAEGVTRDVLKRQAEHRQKHKSAGPETGVQF